jgi:uncharacterized SAM-binding protein YcdF (DUF218 family)
LDLLFLIASKTVWLLIRPETLLVALYAMALVFLRLGRTVAGSRSLAVALSITIAIGVFPVGNFVLNPLERAYSAQPVVTQPAGILVLGGAEGQAPDYAGGIAMVNDAGDRLIVAMHLAQQYPEAVVLYTGGKVALSPVAEGTFQLGPDILRHLGLSEDRLIVEGRSRTTAENAVLSRAIAPDLGGPWILITSAFHMPRALGTFCAAGWHDLVPYPTDYRGGEIWDQIGWNLAENLTDLNIGVKEWVGLLAYRTTGRTVAFFPQGCE